MQRVLVEGRQFPAECQTDGATNLVDPDVNESTCQGPGTAEVTAHAPGEAEDGVEVAGTVASGAEIVDTGDVEVTRDVEVVDEIASAGRVETAGEIASEDTGAGEIAIQVVVDTEVAAEVEVAGTAQVQSQVSGKVEGTVKDEVRVWVTHEVESPAEVVTCRSDLGVAPKSHAVGWGDRVKGAPYTCVLVRHLAYDRTCGGRRLDGSGQNGFEAGFSVEDGVEAIHGRVMAGLEQDFTQACLGVEDYVQSGEQGVLVLVEPLVHGLAAGASFQAMGHYSSSRTPR